MNLRGLSEKIESKEFLIYSGRRENYYCLIRFFQNIEIRRNLSFHVKNRASLCATFCFSKYSFGQASLSHQPTIREERSKKLFLRVSEEKILKRRTIEGMILFSLFQEKKCFFESIFLKLHTRIARKSVRTFFFGAPFKKVQTPIPRENAESHHSNEKHQKYPATFFSPPRRKSTHKRRTRTKSLRASKKHREVLGGTEIQGGRKRSTNETSASRIFRGDIERLLSNGTRRHKWIVGNNRYISRKETW